MAAEKIPKEFIKRGDSIMCFGARFSSALLRTSVLSAFNRPLPPVVVCSVFKRLDEWKNQNTRLSLAGRVFANWVVVI